MCQISVKPHRLPSDIPRHSNWLYAKFPPGFCDAEEMLAEWDLDASYEIIHRRFLSFGIGIAANPRCSRTAPRNHRHLDKMTVVVCRRRAGAGSASAADKTTGCFGGMAQSLDQSRAKEDPARYSNEVRNRYRRRTDAGRRAGPAHLSEDAIILGATGNGN